MGWLNGRREVAKLVAVVLRWCWRGEEDEMVKLKVAMALDRLNAQAIRQFKHHSRPTHLSHHPASISPSSSVVAAFDNSCNMSTTLAMFRPRLLQAQPSRIINMQRRFLNMRPTCRAMAPVPVCTEAQSRYSEANCRAERGAQRYVFASSCESSGSEKQLSADTPKPTPSLSASGRSRRFHQN